MFAQLSVLGVALILVACVQEACCLRRVARPAPQGQESCTLVLRVTDGETGPVDTVECEQDGKYYSVDGDIDFKHQQSGRAQLRYLSSARNGDVITLRRPQEFRVSESLNSDERMQTRGVTGHRTFLAILSHALDDRTSTSEEETSDYIFGTHGDTVTMKERFAACSHGKFTVSPFEGEYQKNPNKRVSGGVMTVNIKNNVSGVHSGYVHYWAQTAFVDVFGDPLSASPSIDYFMWILPGSVKMGIAYAYVGLTGSVYKDKWANYPNVQVHEIGHNLGLGHSGEGSQAYGDQSGFMGYGAAGEDVRRTCFNAPNMYNLGWVADAVIKINPLDVPDFTITLAGLPTYLDRNGRDLILMLTTKTNSGHFVSYNLKQGSRNETLEGGDQVLVHETPNIFYSTLSAKLSQGNSFTITNFADSGRDITISVKSLIPGEPTATIDISTQCPPTQCPPTQSPPTQSPPTQSPPTQSPPSRCADFSFWPELARDGVTCGAGSCMALVWAKNFGGRCSTYCESFGHKCVGAFEEVSDNCEIHQEYSCEDAILGTSDILCECSFG